MGIFIFKSLELHVLLYYNIYIHLLKNEITANTQKDDSYLNKVYKMILGITCWTAAKLTMEFLFVHMRSDQA